MYTPSAVEVNIFFFLFHYFSYLYYGVVALDIRLDDLPDLMWQVWGVNCLAVAHYFQGLVF